MILVTGGEKVMDSTPIMVLVVGETAKSFLQLLLWLYERGCRCHLATSYRDALNLVSTTQFDLVLSQYELRDRTAFPLIDRLAGSPATLFFSTQLEDGSLWLKMLERGQHCVGVQSNDLIAELTKVIGIEGRSDELGTVARAVSARSPRLEAPVRGGAAQGVAWTPQS